MIWHKLNSLHYLRYLLCYLAVAALSAAPVSAYDKDKHHSKSEQNREKEKLAPRSLRGWDSLVSRLRASGISLDLLERVYSDPRMPEREMVPFKVRPIEHAASYEKFYAASRIKLARKYLIEHQADFAKAEKRFGVNPRVIASIHLVETDLGNYLGQSMVLNRLSRLAVLSESENVRWNFNEIKKRKEKATFYQVEDRAGYLDRTFYPQLIALFDYAAQEEVDPITIKGSIAGALGIPQFMPASLLRYGIDGDGDNKVNLFDYADAIMSTANYLAQHGWHDKLNNAQKVQVLLSYNQSPPYAHAILRVADLLR